MIVLFRQMAGKLEAGVQAALNPKLGNEE
jgi:hypothetical protein